MGISKDYCGPQSCWCSCDVSRINCCLYFGCCVSCSSSLLPKSFPLKSTCIVPKQDIEDAAHAHSLSSPFPVCPGHYHSGDDSNPDTIAVAGLSLVGCPPLTQPRPNPYFSSQSLARIYMPSRKLTAISQLRSPIKPLGPRKLFSMSRISWQSKRTFEAAMEGQGAAFLPRGAVAPGTDRPKRWREIRPGPVRLGVVALLRGFRHRLARAERQGWRLRLLVWWLWRA